MKRQGDLLFIKIDTVPEYQQEQITNDNVILFGEVTGHAHRLEKGIVIKKWRDEIYLILTEPSRVVHEEHAPIDLDTGTYSVIRQREYISPDEERTIYD